MTITLAAGRLSLELEPQLGGSVGRFALQGRSSSFDLMRPLRGRRQSVHAAMFPMAPSANRIRNNRFVFDGRSHEVSANTAGRLNFHGSAWLSAWQPRAVTSASAVLDLDDGQVDDVYRYAASQGFLLDDDTLTVTFSVTNHGDRPMPFGFGLHPWFPTHGGVRVGFTSSDILQMDAEGQLASRESVGADTDYLVPRAPPADYVNVCYAGWNGLASIDWPEAGVGLRMRADPLLGNLMVHVPNTGEPVFCLEPQSNAPCAFDGLATGRNAPGLHVLASGGGLSATVRFAVEC